MEGITAIITSLGALIIALATLISNFIKAKKEIEDTLPRKIQKQCDIDIDIINMMEETKEFLNADRVQIYDFHNRWALC